MFERQRHLKPPEEERRGHDRDRGYGRALHLAAGAAKPVRPPRQRAVRLVQSQGEQALSALRDAAAARIQSNPIRNRRSQTTQTLWAHAPTNEGKGSTSRPASSQHWRISSPHHTPRQSSTGGGGAGRGRGRGAAETPDLDGVARRVAEGGMAMATRSGRKRARGGVRMGERERKVRGTGRGR